MCLRNRFEKWFEKCVWEIGLRNCLRNEFWKKGLGNSLRNTVGKWVWEIYLGNVFGE